MVVNKVFYNKVKGLLEKKNIAALKACITAPEQLLWLGKKVVNDPNAVYHTREDAYSVYNHICQAFPEYPELLEYFLENKFHKAAIMKSEDYHYLTPSGILETYTRKPNFCDDDCIQLIHLLTKYKVEIEELLSSVYYNLKLTTRSIKCLMKHGVNLHDERHQGLLVNPPLNNDTQNGYDKTAFLLVAGMPVNYIQVSEYDEDIQDHVLDIICSSYCFHIPYLFLYINHGARRAGFVHRLVELKSKKGLKFKYTLVKFYLAKQPELVNEYNGVGLTPLHLAVVQGDVKMVELLLLCGADTTLVTQNTRVKTIKKRKIKKNNTALDLANLVDMPALTAVLNKTWSTAALLTDSAVIPTLDASFHQVLLKYITTVIDFTEAGGFKHLFASFDKALLNVTLPVIPSLVYDLALASWGELKPHHYQLLHVALVLGGQRFSWSKEGTGGVIEFASWIDLLNKNILCRYEDMGTTFVSPNKKNVRLNFASTYNGHKVFRLNLTLEEFLEKTFQSLGVSYWMFCFISPKYDLMTTIPFFEEQLQQAVGVSLEDFCKK